MSYCGEHSVVNSSGDGVTAVTLRCKRWSCPDCFEFLCGGIRRLALAGHPVTFITLTVNPAMGNDPDERARALVHAWQIVVKRAKRKYRLSDFPYMVVVEATKRGEPHLHVLTRVRWIDWAFLRDCMAELINAPIVRIERLKYAKAAASYVAKYLSKGPELFKGCKRYWQSRSWIEDKAAWNEAQQTKQLGWQVVRTPIAQLARDYIARGYSIHWNSLRSFEGHRDNLAGMMRDLAMLRRLSYEPPQLGDLVI